MSNLLASMDSLPVMPEVAAKILAIAETDLDFSFTELENIIKMDPGLTSRVLKVANSALYARSKEITNLQTAIGLMGFKSLRSMVVLVTASALYKHKSSQWILKALWRESVESAFICKSLALATGNREFAEESFLAGLLQDIGKLALAMAMPDEYATIHRTINEDSPVPDEALAVTEEKQFGLNHKELGYQVLQKWNFPDLYSELCRDHGSLHVPPRYKKLIILASIGSTLGYLNHQNPIPEESKSFLNPFLPYLGLTMDGLENFRKNHGASLEKDSLYKSCMVLIA